MSAITVESCMGARISFGQTLFGGGVDLQGELPERTLVIIGSDALERSLLGCSLDWSAGVRSDSVKHGFGHGIPGLQQQSVTQLVRGARRIAHAVEFDGQIEVVVGIVWVRFDCLLKVLGGSFSVALRTDNSQVVVNLGQGQSGC